MFSLKPSFHCLCLLCAISIRLSTYSNSDDNSVIIASVTVANSSQLSTNRLVVTL